MNLSLASFKAFRFAAAFGVVVSALFFFTGCKPLFNNDPLQPTTADKPVAEKPLILAVQPFNTPSKVESNFAPILHFLSKVLQRPVALYLATSYEDQIRKIATNQVDLAYMGPSSFVTAFDKFSDEKGRKIQPIVTEKPYQAALVANENSDINDWKDLKNKTMAFSAYFSYAGHFWARQAMRDHGVHLSDIKLYTFTGRHERAVLSVAYGDYQVATTTLSIAEKMQALNYPIKIVQISKPLAPIMYVGAPALDGDIIQKLKVSMLQPDFEEQESITLFAPGGKYFAYNPQDYETVRTTIKWFEQ